MSYYTGISPDVNRRVEQHNLGKGAVYTRTRTPVNLVYFEEYPNRSEASKREYEIKQIGHEGKKKMVESTHVNLFF